MTQCRYHSTNGECELMAATGERVYVPPRFCAVRCWPNHPPAQIAMLRRLKVELPPLPDGVDLLDHAKACVADGTAKLSPSAQERAEKKRRDEEERQRMLVELSGDFRLAANLAKHLKKIHAHYKETGRVYVSPEVAEKRREICRNCPSGKSVVDDDGVLRCTVKTCGCRLSSPLEPNGGAVRAALDAVAKVATGDAQAELRTKPEYEALECELGHWARPQLFQPLAYAYRSGQS